MAQILPRQGSFGQTLGGGIGQLLGQTLSGIAEKKQAEAQQSALAQSLEQLGFPQAQALAQLPPETLQDVLKGLGQRGMVGGMQQQQQMYPTEQVQDALANPNYDFLDRKDTPPASIADILRQPTLAQQREQEKLDLKKEALAFQLNS